MAVSAELVTGVALWLLLNLLVPLLVKCAELSLRSSPLHWRWLRGGGRRGSLKRKRRARGGECDSKGGENTRSECANKGVGVGLDSSVEEDGGESGGRRGGADGEMRGSKGEAGGNDGRAQGEREQEEVTLTSGVTSSMGYIQVHTTCFNPWLERLRMLPAKSPAKRFYYGMASEGVRVQHVACFLLVLLLPHPVQSCTYLPLFCPFPIPSLTTRRVCECSTWHASSSLCCSPEHTSRSTPLAVQRVASFPILSSPLAPLPIQRGSASAARGMLPPRSAAPQAHVAFHPADFHALPPFRLLRILSAGIWHNMVVSAGIWHNMVVSAGWLSFQPHVTSLCLTSAPSCEHMWPSIPSSLCLPPARLLRVLSAGTVAQHSGESCALSVEVEQVGCGGATVAQHSGESCALSVEVEQVGCGGATVAQHSGESCAFLHGLAPPSLVSSLVSLPTFSLPLPAFPLPAESAFRHQLAQHSAVSAAPLLSPFLQTALFLPLYPILSTLFPSFPTHLIWPHSHLCSCLCSLCCSYPLPSKRSSSFPSTPSHHQALSPPPGLKVTSVHPLSPLFSHIRPGDSLLVLDHTPLSSPADYTHLLSHLSHLSHVSYPLPPSIPPSPPSRGYCISLSANHKLPPGFLTPPAFPANAGDAEPSLPIPGSEPHQEEASVQFPGDGSQNQEEASQMGSVCMAPVLPHHHLLLLVQFQPSPYSPSSSSTSSSFSSSSPSSSTSSTPSSLEFVGTIESFAQGLSLSPWHPRTLTLPLTLPNFALEHRKLFSSLMERPFSQTSSAWFSLFPRILSPPILSPPIICTSVTNSKSFATIVSSRVSFMGALSYFSSPWLHL
ncbi:unnamed protein product [Closterium sp. NIES-65]|nr:unnamed protein product [Closterium sp. NIES-65]